MRSPLLSVIRWFDSEAGVADISVQEQEKRVDWFRVLPLIGLHAGCLLVFWAGITRDLRPVPPSVLKG